MDFFSHFLIGILISVVFLSPFGSEYVIYAGTIAIIADFDIFLEIFNSKRKSSLLSHKGASHSYMAGLFVSFITAGVFTLIMGLADFSFDLETFITAWLIGFVFYSLHVTLDALAASKIPLFYPFSKKRYRFFIDRAVNPLLALFSGFVLIFYLILFLFFPLVYYSNIFYVFLAFYLTYLAYRLFTKIWVELRLPKNKHYIPGILPFTYFIYENDTNETMTTFKLLKKTQFLPKTIEIIETRIKAESEDMEFFMIAKSLSRNYLFFSKWENIIPIISKNDGEIIILLFLAESFASSTAYSLQVVFNRQSKEVIFLADRFGRILNKKNQQDNFYNSKSSFSSD